MLSVYGMKIVRYAYGYGMIYARYLYITEYSKYYVSVFHFSEITFASLIVY
jgi:hypothetical protein